MICVAISDKSLDKCLATLDKVELAEIRIDLTEFDEDQVRKVCSHPTPTVATCRADKTGPEKQFKLLSAAIEAGARYADVEIEAGKEQIDRIGDLAHKHNCRLIVSYHNFEKTPELKELHKILDTCFALGADIAKIATQINSNEESARILALYTDERPKIAIGMGEAGKVTRVMAPLLGAEFTFAAMDDGEPTAPGQITYTVMKKAIERLKNSND
jgi:3-dehydroquinate dehydratase I